MKFICFNPNTLLNTNKDKKPGKLGFILFRLPDEIGPFQHPSEMLSDVIDTGFFKLGSFLKSINRPCPGSTILL
jgi:hypothetical protein